MDIGPGKRPEYKHSSEWKGLTEYPTTTQLRGAIQFPILGKPHTWDQLSLSPHGLTMLPQSHVTVTTSTDSESRSLGTT